MPVSRLHVTPTIEPLRPVEPRVAPVDPFHVALLRAEEQASRDGLGLGTLSAVDRPGAPTAQGATATPPSVGARPTLMDAPIATAIGPLGPVRAARWNAQLPASAAGADEPAVAGAVSPKAEATSS